MTLVNGITNLQIFERVGILPEMVVAGSGVIQRWEISG
jgi:hypothetical protein